MYKTKNLAPIALFVYNRPKHSIATINTLRVNKLADESHLIVFSDGPKKYEDSGGVSLVRENLSQIKGFKSLTVVERNQNLGLANSIIFGVSDVIEKNGKVIVLEDDLITSPYFLTYMNDALNIYENDNRIFSVTGYNLPQQSMKIPANYPHDVYLNYRCHSWGWGTWENRWQKSDWKVSTFKDFINNKEDIELFKRGGDDLSGMLIDQMEGKKDSWAIRWCFTHFLERAYCLYPVQSLIENRGLDGSGIHCSTKGKKKRTEPINDSKHTFIFPANIKIHDQIMKNFREFFRYGIISKLYVKCRIWRIKRKMNKWDSF